MFIASASVLAAIAGRRTRRSLLLSGMRFLLGGTEKGYTRVMRGEAGDGRGAVILSGFFLRFGRLSMPTGADTDTIPASAVCVNFYSRHEVFPCGGGNNALNHLPLGACREAYQNRAEHSRAEHSIALHSSSIPPRNRVSRGRKSISFDPFALAIFAVTGRDVCTYFVAGI